MDRFFKLLYYYLLGAFVLFVLYLTVMLAISPKQDRQKRGFIGCTEQLVIDVAECERGTIGCPLKHLSKDMKCNTFVILEGLGAWVKGKQNTPWANYLFEPAPFEQDDENIKNNVENIDNLEQKRLFIQLKQQELEASKARLLNLREDVLMSAPEDVLPDEYKENITLPDEDSTQTTEDISDEAFMDDIKTVEQNTEEKPKNEEK